METRQQVALVERQIAGTKELIAKQLELLERLHRDGRQTKEAEKLLASLVDSLGAYETFREQAADRLAGASDLNL